MPVPNLQRESVMNQNNFREIYVFKYWIRDNSEKILTIPDSEKKLESNFSKRYLNQSNIRITISESALIQNKNQKF